MSFGPFAVDGHLQRSPVVTIQVDFGTLDVVVGRGPDSYLRTLDGTNVSLPSDGSVFNAGVFRIVVEDAVDGKRGRGTGFDDERPRDAVAGRKVIAIVLLQSQTAWRKGANVPIAVLRQRHRYDLIGGLPVERAVMKGDGFVLVEAIEFCRDGKRIAIETDGITGPHVFDRHASGGIYGSPRQEQAGRGG